MSVSIIATSEQYLKEASRIANNAEEILYCSSFGLFVKNNQEDLIRVLDEAAGYSTTIPDARMIVGVSFTECSPGCKCCAINNNKAKQRYQEYEKKWSIAYTEKLHMKLVMNESEALIGGMNLSCSNWVDFAIIEKRKSILIALQEYYQVTYNSLYYPYEFPEFNIEGKPVFEVGKHKGKTVEWVEENYPGYIDWVKSN